MRHLSLSFSKRILASLVLAALLGGCGNAPMRTGAPQPPSLPGAYENALALMQSGDYPAAIVALRSFIVDNPGLSGPWLNLGIAYRHTNDLNAAFDALNKAVELNPNHAAAYQQLGIVYRERGQFDAALNAYDRALKLDPEYALAHRNIGILYDLYLQRPGMALSHYRKYLELTGDGDSDVNGWVADLERRLGDTQARMEK